MKREDSFFEIVNVNLKEYDEIKLKDRGIVNWLEQGMTEIQKKNEDGETKKFKRGFLRSSCSENHGPGMG